MKTQDLTFIQLSSLEKVFLDEEISNLTEINELTALKGERISYQILYTGEEGPYESIRSAIFYEGIQDLRACQILEKYIGRKAVLDIIEENEGITFNKFPRTNFGVLALREKIDRKLKSFTEINRCLNI